jgi:anti-sigma factor RsiW
MCDKELLVTYVYDELQGAERTAFEQHLHACQACRGEVEALRGTRVHLTSWAPQEPDLRFQIVRSAPVPGRIRWSPAWGLAAAAVLVLAVASAIANIEITTSADGIVVRTGRTRVADPAAVAPAGAGRDEIVALQRQIRALETALANIPSARPVVPVSTGRVDGDADVLRRIRQLIAASEERQQQEFATRLVEIRRELQASHTTDLVRLQQTLTQSQGPINDEVFRQREQLNQFYRLVGSQR